MNGIGLGSGQGSSEGLGVGLVSYSGGGRVVDRLVMKFVEVHP